MPTHAPDYSPLCHLPRLAPPGDEMTAAETTPTPAHAMGRAPMWRLLLQMAFPPTLAVIVMALYSIVDRAFVGNIVGVDALSGLSAAVRCRALESFAGSRAALPTYEHNGQMFGNARGGVSIIGVRFSGGF